MHMDKKYIPIISGTASLAFLEFVIFDDSLEFSKYWVALSTICIIFLVSAVLFYLLSKLEKEKDVSILDKVQKIVESVFEKYGAIVSKNNPAATQIEDMNKIMQTIVNLAEKFNIIAEKNYKK